MPEESLPTKEPKVALVHDFFTEWGGAEVVLDALYQAFPNSDIYAAVDLPETRHKPIDSIPVKTSFLQKFPFQKSFLKT